MRPMLGDLCFTSAMMLKSRERRARANPRVGPASRILVFRDLSESFSRLASDSVRVASTISLKLSAMAVACEVLWFPGCGCDRDHHDPGRPRNQCRGLTHPLRDFKASS